MEKMSGTGGDGTERKEQASASGFYRRYQYKPTETCTAPSEPPQLHLVEAACSFESWHRVGDGFCDRSACLMSHSAITSCTWLLGRGGGEIGRERTCMRRREAVQIGICGKLTGSETGLCNG